jgi:hypothetical protein
LDCGLALHLLSWALSCFTFTHRSLQLQQWSVSSRAAFLFSDARKEDMMLKVELEPLMHGWVVKL